MRCNLDEPRDPACHTQEYFEVKKTKSNQAAIPFELRPIVMFDAFCISPFCTSPDKPFDKPYLRGLLSHDCDDLPSMFETIYGRTLLIKVSDRVGSFHVLSSKLENRIISKQFTAVIS